MTRTRVGAPEPEGDGSEELPVWLAAGFDKEEAEIWRGWRFSVAEAENWKKAGVDEGLRAAQWSTAGVTASSVQVWRDARIEAPEAVRWHEMGFGLEAARSEKRRGLGPEEAFARQHQTRRRAMRSRVVRSFGSVGPAVIGGSPHSIQRFHESGADPRVMRGYMQYQWFDDEAIAWATQFIEAPDAYIWHELGLAPAEAARLAWQGRTPGDVIREWWCAGIPFDEVADWIGAGLDVHEALEQRSRGVTSEQAAALRALRREEATPKRSGPQMGMLLSRHGPPGSEHVGPPPKYEDEARTQITESFVAMLTPDEASDAIPAVDGGSNLGDCLKEAARRYGLEGERPDNLPATTVSVDLIRFVNDHQARVMYSVIVGGPSNINLQNRIGRAILVDGRWKVTRDTFCEFMQMAGVQCPPREGS